LSVTHSIVIGAGFGGLACALRLAARGHRVTVLDRLEGPGGRAREFVRPALAEHAGQSWRYDAGPTVLTAPVLFEELFALHGEKLSDHVNLLPVKPWYRMQFADGTLLDYGGDTAHIQQEIAKFSPRDAQAYTAFLEHSRKLFDKGYVELGSQAFLGWRSMLKALPAMMRLRADRSVYQLVSRYFSDERIRRAFSIQPLLVGGNPMDTTSIYSLIHHLERRWGIWYPQGGMARLVQALVELGLRHGVQFKWNATVKQIEARSGQANAVVLSGGERINADQVISNGDPGWVMTQLLPPELQQPRSVKRKNYSMGLFVWYFSTKERYSDVPHHTILFGNSYQDVLRKIFNTQELPDDLSIYLHRPTATDTSYAPEGYDSFYALVPVPNLSADIDWTYFAWLA
jgi:phytoene desaturase